MIGFYTVLSAWRSTPSILCNRTNESSSSVQQASNQSDAESTSVRGWEDICQTSAEHICMHTESRFLMLTSMMFGKISVPENVDVETMSWKSCGVRATDFRSNNTNLNKTVSLKSKPAHTVLGWNIITPAARNKAKQKYFNQRNGTVKNFPTQHRQFLNWKCSVAFTLCLVLKLSCDAFCSSLSRGLLLDFRLFTHSYVKQMSKNQCFLIRWNPAIHRISNLLYISLAG